MSIPYDRILGNPKLVLICIAIISSIGLLISNLEWLKLAKHFRENGIYSWEVRSVRLNFLIPKKYTRIFNKIFSYPNILMFLILRIFLVILLFFTVNHHFLFGLICLTLVLLSVIFSLRGNEGTTGADQMNTITLLAIGLSIISPSNFAYEIAIIFLSLQLILAYSTSGWIRILEPTWRSGEDLLVVLRQQTYGNKRVWLSVKNLRIERYVSMSILIFECLSCVIIFLPLNVVFLYCCLGLIFHLANAFVMGLNIFVWSFTPLLIAYFWTAVKIQEII